MASTTVKFSCGDFKKFSYTGNAGYKAIMAKVGATDVQSGSIIATIACQSHAAATATARRACSCGTAIPDHCSSCHTECFGDCGAWNPVAA